MKLAYINHQYSILLGQLVKIEDKNKNIKNPLNYPNYSEYALKLDIFISLGLKFLPKSTKFTFSSVCL